ncbi:MAG: ABC transporter substrate-binding protein [Lachnospiraceae bacterium]|nr:ABC transporter substrate-binding protein [Lachnospiraceae bacterium]
MKKRIMLLFALAFCLSSCGRKESQEPVVLVLAAFQEHSELHRQVDIFNQNHPDYQIEIKNYQRADRSEEDGIAQIQREIISGGGPDLIDFGDSYSNTDVMGGYTEDLLPYLEGEREEYFTNILDSFCYKGCLYAIPTQFSLDTFAGSKEALGGLEQWNVQEMIACYQEQTEGVMLYPGETRYDVLSRILTGSMEYYIDWESGTCSFNQEEFKQVLSFAASFPEGLELDNDFSVKQAFLDGKALIIPTRIMGIYDIARAEYIFASTDISYIGYPVEGTSGTVISPKSPVLAISGKSEYKEICWEFISQYLGEEYQKKLSFPINRAAMEEKLAQSLETEYDMVDGEKQPMVKSQVNFEGDDQPQDIYCLTKEQTQRLMQLIESASINDAYDHHLYRIIMDEADGYFSGDKTLDETADIIQNKASIYVSENS